ncbi:MAG: alpha/beta fold hydrolase [Candidatus Dormibacteria bacterium]
MMLGRVKMVAAVAAGAGSILAASMGAAPLVDAKAGAEPGACVDHNADVLSIQQAAPGLYNEGFAGTPSQGITGIFTLPVHKPHSLVIMAHGHHNNSSSWQRHALDARSHGAIAVAVDYRGLGPSPAYEGWPALAGSQDLVSSAQYFLRRCPSIKRVVLVGISMGGNMSGMAMAAAARRPGSDTPLFDYWVDIEGVNNWLETYAEAAATRNMAQGEIEAECGGQTPILAPDCYRSRTVTARVPDIVSSRVKGIAVVHSVEDGLVPSDQSREFVTVARPAGLAVDMYNVLRRSSDTNQSGQTTLLSDLDGNADCTGGASGAVGPLPASVVLCDPLAGHGWEGSDTQVTIATGMALTWNFISAQPQQPANRECLVDAGAVNPLGTACAPSVAPASSQVASAPPAIARTTNTVPAAASAVTAVPPAATHAKRARATIAAAPSRTTSSLFGAVGATLANFVRAIARAISG